MKIVSLTDLFHSVATGPKRRRELLTPLGLLVFGGSLAIVIVGGLHTMLTGVFAALFGLGLLLHQPLARAATCT